MRVNFLFLFILYFLLIKAVLAQIMINEFQIEPEQQVELWNNSENVVDLSGWHLDDNGGTTYYTIADNTLIYPQTCLVIAGNIYLNKSSEDTIRLFNNTKPPTDQNAVLIDSYHYSKSPGERLSFQRMPDLSENWQAQTSSLGLSNNLLTDCLFIPTPTINPLPTTTIPTSTLWPTPTIPATPEVAEIYLSEIMADPEEGSEWVELFNANNFSVALVDWYLDDQADSGSTPKKFSLDIGANSYAVHSFSSAMLNNNGDSVRLLDSQKNELDSVEYDNAKKGLSLSRQNFTAESTWCWTDPSPETTNQSCPDITTTISKTIIPTLTTILSSKPINNTFSDSHFQPQALQIELNMFIPTPRKPQVLGASTKLINIQKQAVNLLTFWQKILTFNLLFSLISTVFAIYVFWKSGYNINRYDQVKN